MTYIPTSQTRLQKLRAEAKQISKANGLPLRLAQDQVAKLHGYHHWKHVTVCAHQAIAALGVASVPSARPSVDELRAQAKTLMDQEERALLEAMSPEGQAVWLLHRAKELPAAKGRFTSIQRSWTLR